MLNTNNPNKDTLEWELSHHLNKIFSISFSQDMTESDFRQFELVWKEFLDLLHSKNREWYYAEILVKNVIKLISEKNLQRLFPKVPKIFIWKIWYELFTWVIAYCFQKGIKSDYILLQKMKNFSSEIDNSGINTLFSQMWNETLVNVNNQVVKKILAHKTRDLPLSFILEIPWLSKQRFWVLYEQKWKFTSQNLERWKQSWEMNDIFLKVWDNFHQLRDSYVTVFFWDKEPHQIKINTVQQENSETSLNKAIFRDQLGTIIFYAGMFFDSCISLSLWSQAEKLKALILLWIAPVILRKEIVEDIYKSYGIDFNNFHKNTSSWNSDIQKWDSNWIRNYPYDHTLKLKISDLMENEETKEINTRVVHKRLLPVLKRPDGSYISSKPSQRAATIAKEKWFMLWVGVWFPEKGTCIYPEKIQQLLSTLWVETLDDALISLTRSWEIVALRYETIVIPVKEEFHDNVSTVIKAKVWGVLDK